MKNLLFLLLGCGLFFACNKEEIKTLSSLENNSEYSSLEKKEYRPDLKNGYLVFECEEKMEEFIVGYTKKNVDPSSISETYGYNSYYDVVPNTPQNEVIFEDEYFAATINQYGMIGIGEYIFKMNPSTEEVFALSSTASNQSIKAMQKATSQDELPSDALIFSFEDKVFQLLEGNTSCEEKFDCGEPCSPNNLNFIDNPSYCETSSGLIGDFHIHVRYIHIGIWKHATLVFKQGSNTSEVANFDIRYSARWKRKCRTPISSESNNYVCNFVPLQGEDECFPFKNTPKFKVNFYQGTRCLSAYDFRADARIESICDENSLVWTGEVRIVF